MTDTTVYAQYVAYTDDGDRREFRLELRGESNTLYAVSDKGKERNHGGRALWDDALMHASLWAERYEESQSFYLMGFMRVV